MIPTFEADLEATLPVDHSYWTPRPGDIGEEGFGFFRDTWPMGRWRVSDARALIVVERELVALADDLSDDAATYEKVARALEHSDRQELPEHLVEGPSWQQIEGHLVDSDPPPLGGLELGVGGLVVALASVGGCFPAASCRAHHERSWASHPVVLLAVDAFRAQCLSVLVEETGCGFGVDGARPELIAIGASSVKAMMALAQRILAEVATFRQPQSRQASRSPRGRDGGVQESFDLS